MMIDGDKKCVSEIDINKTQWNPSSLSTVGSKHERRDVTKCYATTFAFGYWFILAAKKKMKFYLGILYDSKDLLNNNLLAIQFIIYFKTSETEDKKVDDSKKQKQ